MVATAKLERALYAAQDSWRPIRRGKSDTTARGLFLFADKATRSKPSVKAAIAQARRLTRKAPQAMVKVSKATYGAKHTFSNFTYISRNGAEPMYDQDGVEISDIDQMRTLADEWHELNFNGHDEDARYPTPDARRIILSMPRGTDPEIVLQSARATARHLFEDKFDYVFAFHVDEGRGKSPNPHVHLTVRAQGHAGEKLAFGREDLLYMRRVFAAELRQRGIDADATPQIARGPRLNNEHSRNYQARLRVERNNQDERKPRQVFERDLRRRQTGQDREWVSGDIVKRYSELISEMLNSDDQQYRTLGRELGLFTQANHGLAFAAKEAGIALRPTTSTADGLEKLAPKRPRL